MTWIPGTMRALRLLAWEAPPELVELPVPVPSGPELLLRVDAAGLCHSDLHIMDAPAGALPYELPFTLGHEVVGTVVATGDAAEPEWLGRRVAVHGVWSCGRCRQCQRGRENHCFALTGPIGGGIGRDGGLADYMLVPAARHLVPVEGIAPLLVAPLTDAGLTAHHALHAHRALLPGATVVVIGVGGLGHLALQLLGGHDPACVVAVEPRTAGRQLAMKLGADAVVPAVADAAAWLDDCDGGYGADLVLDLVGTQDTMADAAALLAPGGRLVLVGSAGGHLAVGKAAGLARGWEVSAPFWGTRRDLAEVVRLAETGRIRAEVETYRLGEALAAYDCLRAGRVQGRAVVVPG